MCISAPFVQMSREVNIKKYKFFKNTPQKKARPVQTSGGVIKNIDQRVNFCPFSLPTKWKDYFENKGAAEYEPFEREELRFE